MRKLLIYPLIYLCTVCDASATVDFSVPRPLLRTLSQFYSQEKWSNFFGTIAWFRARGTQNSEMMRLEALALFRHCRYPEALSIIDEAIQKSHPSQNQKLSQSLQEIRAHLKIFTVDHLNDAQDGILPASIESEVPGFQGFRSSVWWKTSSLQTLLKVPDYGAVRMQVRDLCKDSEIDRSN